MCILFLEQIQVGNKVLIFLRRQNIFLPILQEKRKKKPQTKDYMLFRHEKIYRNHNIDYTIDNSEMKNKYKFVSDDGIDKIYASGYMQGWNLFYKYIPHGFAYAGSDLGYFDLLTFLMKMISIMLKEK